MTSEQYTALCVMIAKIETKLDPLLEKVEDYGLRINKLEKLEVKLTAYMAVIGAGLTTAAKYLLPATLTLVVAHGILAPSHATAWTKTQWTMEPHK